MNIILGGTSGLGEGITKQLRSKGDRVLVLGRSYDIKKHGEGILVDLTDKSSVIACVLQLKDVLGGQKLKSFWWVAGYGYSGDFAKQGNPEDMAVANFSGALPLVQFIWQKLLEQNNGTLAVVSSTTGLKARNSEAVYAGTKHAQVGFARSLGSEAERLGSSIKVALFMPGGMRTPFWTGSQPEAYESFNDPEKVALKMVSTVGAQGSHYEELIIERGEMI